MPEPFDPNSSSAMFATILEKLEHIQHTSEQTQEEVRKTNGRVTGLERWRDITNTKTGVIAALVAFAVVVAGWAVRVFSA